MSLLERGGEGEEGVGNAYERLGNLLCEHRLASRVLEMFFDGKLTSALSSCISESRNAKALARGFVETFKRSFPYSFEYDLSDSLPQAFLSGLTLADFGPFKVNFDEARDGKVLVEIGLKSLDIFVQYLLSSLGLNNVPISRFENCSTDQFKICLIELLLHYPPGSTANSLEALRFALTGKAFSDHSGFNTLNNHLKGCIGDGGSSFFVSGDQKLEFATEPSVWRQMLCWRKIFCPKLPAPLLNSFPAGFVKGVYAKGMTVKHPFRIVAVGAGFGLRLDPNFDISNLHKVLGDALGVTVNMGNNSWFARAQEGLPNFARALHYLQGEKSKQRLLYYLASVDDFDSSAAAVVLKRKSQDVEVNSLILRTDEHFGEFCSNPINKVDPLINIVRTNLKYFLRGTGGVDLSNALAAAAKNQADSLKWFEEVSSIVEGFKSRILEGFPPNVRRAHGDSAVVLAVAAELKCSIFSAAFQEETSPLPSPMGGPEMMIRNRTVARRIADRGGSSRPSARGGGRR